ncbi:hypothetical protein BJ508DRAFT_307327 [Ascobolus immersus RN42]|uniref:Uncharacterized protein n=1 Tax=Ascobolus immersus RN42 TaxID=1160509 RepID=A0A3N4I3D7_ASCIM|nr:hypothetical protein BJ508DRAFT_307327 [Ascobolus immersus RN42]
MIKDAHDRDDYEARDAQNTSIHSKTNLYRNRSKAYMNEIRHVRAEWNTRPRISRHATKTPQHGLRVMMKCNAVVRVVVGTKEKIFSTNIRNLTRFDSAQQLQEKDTYWNDFDTFQVTRHTDRVKERHESLPPVPSKEVAVGPEVASTRSCRIPPQRNKTYRKDKNQSPVRRTQDIVRDLGMDSCPHAITGRK